jgi:hypothetical protein
MADDLANIAAPALENVEIPGQGIASETLLHLQRKAAHAAPHIRVPRLSRSERLKEQGSPFDGPQHRRHKPRRGAARNVYDRPLKLHDRRRCHGRLRIRLHIDFGKVPGCPVHLLPQL